jgi:hypothetical protein
MDRSPGASARRRLTHHVTLYAHHHRIVVADTARDSIHVHHRIQKPVVLGDSRRQHMDGFSGSTPVVHRYHKCIVHRIKLPK